MCIFEVRTWSNSSSAVNEMKTNEKMTVLKVTSADKNDAKT